MCIHGQRRTDSSFLDRNMESQHFAHKHLKTKHNPECFEPGFLYLFDDYRFRIVRNNNLTVLMFYKHFNPLHSIQEIIVSLSLNDTTFFNYYITVRARMSVGQLLFADNFSHIPV